MKITKIEWFYDLPNDFTGIAENRHGDRIWFKDKKRHRIEGPAEETFGGSKAWYKNGILHRGDGGPAVEYNDKKYHVEYWINGKEVTQKAAELYA